MLGLADAVATIAVKNLPAAAEFYEKKLGLKKVSSEGDQAFLYQSGSSKVLVYASQFAGTNKATAATWAVDDVDGAVRELKGKGVTFERYDFPNVSHEGDVHVFGKRRNAWFKDPDGNILAVVNK
jgi:catechol 2,3-dioxygenase-like lactoylglutathione lyase family enzyme